MEGAAFLYIGRGNESGIHCNRQDKEPEIYYDGQNKKETTHVAEGFSPPVSPLEGSRTMEW